MKASTWLRSLAAVLGVFAVGHTIGLLKPAQSGSQAAVADTMRSISFPVMGFHRSYWEFYRGFGLFLSVDLVVLGVIAWQLSGISRRDPRQAVPMAITLQLACLASFILSWSFFFAAPIVVSLLAVFCSTAALVRLRKDSQRSGVASGPA
jgi:hypothetical protein